MRSRSYSASPMLDGRGGRDRAGQTDEGRRRSPGAPPRGRRRAGTPRVSDRHWVSSSGRGRVVVQELLGQAHAADVDRQHRLHRRSCRTANSVDPPPMSTTRNGPSAGIELGGGAPERERPLLVAGQQLGAAPSTSAAGPKKSSRLAASRAAEVAVARTRSTPCPVHDVAVLAQHVDRALDGLGIEPAGRVDALCPSRVMRMRRSRVAQAAGRRVGLGDRAARSEFVPHVDRAATRRRSTGRRPRRAARRPSRPTGSSPPARYQA